MAVYRGTLTFDRFTMIPNAWLRDKRLRASDKGVLAYILSHSPEYPLTIEQMIAEGADGPDAVTSALKRLEAVGYLRRERKRDEMGRLGAYDWHLIDPDAGGAQSGKSATGSDLPKQRVSAGRDQSGKTSPGFTSLEKAGTKKTMPKNTTVENHLEVHCEAADASSSGNSVADEEPRSQRSKTRRQTKAQRDAQHAYDLIVNIDYLGYTFTDDEIATFLQWLRDNYGVRNLGPYVQRVIDDDGEDKLAELVAQAWQDVPREAA